MADNLLDARIHFPLLGQARADDLVVHILHQEALDFEDGFGPEPVLVFGLLGFPGLLCCVVGLIFGGLGIFIGLSSNEVYRRYHLPPNGKATAGIILGTIAVVLNIVLTLSNFLF